MQAEKEPIIRLLKTARGQLDGILKMVEDDRYCIDISNQISATDSILRKVNKMIIQAHMKHCVKDGIENGNAEEKIEELLSIVDKLAK